MVGYELSPGAQLLFFFFNVICLNSDICLFHFYKKKEERQWAIRESGSGDYRNH